MTNESFSKKGYCLERNIISEDIANLSTQYALFDEMQNFSSGESQGFYQVPSSHSKYADPLMESLLLYLQPKIEKISGNQLLPTYSFYRVYRMGQVLVPHKDRESCEISVSICFNYSYDDNEYSWPISIEKKEINMYPTDAVVYKGIDLEHSRDYFMPPSEDDWHVQAFFHYVSANGPYKEYVYDKRSSVGEKLIENKKRYISYS